MSKITSKTTLKELAAIVSKKLNEHGITAVLVGGAVVSIYTDFQYKSFDLDFVTWADSKEIDRVLSKLGFVKTENRYYANPKTKFFIEFPPPPLSIGDEIIKKWNKLQSKSGQIELFSPTQSVMDRLAAFYHWNDRESLHQACLVARKQKINLNKVKSWSKTEGMEDKFEEFKKKVRAKRSKF